MRLIDCLTSVQFATRSVFADAFSHELMPVLYRNSNVFLYMAIQEPFGNVYIEALASGTPIVAHDDENTR